MNLRAAILIASPDEDAVRRIAAGAGDGYLLLRAGSWEEAGERIRVHAPAVAVVDTRCGPVFGRLDEWPKAYPGVPLILMGRPRSDPMLRARGLDVFAFADPADGPDAWSRLLPMATRHHQLLEQVRTLADTARATPPPELRPPEPSPSGASSIIAHVAGAFRHFEHVDLMLDRALEGLAAAAHTTRAGLFTRDEDSGRYRLRAGQRTMRETAEAEYEPHDPLVRWFERHAHMITRTLAGQLQDPAEKKLLTRTLEVTGAEVIAPLHARGALLGWIFLGCRSTGQPYQLRELEELSAAADYLAMLLENALLYREVSVQKSLAETLLHTLPTGIVAVDRRGVIRWFSTSAVHMLGRAAADAIGYPVDVLGSRLADAVRRAMGGMGAPAESIWEDPVSHRCLRIEARPLGAADEYFGAVLMMQDLTAVRQMQEKQEQLERAAFWTDLAAGLSHEIRNPLVTIRTFAQLLPERYQDEEFRDEFSKLVATEVDRLGGIIDQINDFAHPPDPVRSRTDVRVLLKEAFRQVLGPAPDRRINVTSEFDGNLPLVLGDERALTDCFARLITNAVEAMADRPSGAIACTAHARPGSAGEPLVEITIADNGRGIPADVLEKVYSPFYTTKARGMGLGLPIVKRTVIDHNGRVSIDSAGEGARVVIQLPAAGPRGGNP